MEYVVIMAGGSGTRLWPLSRQGMPKQLLRLVGGKSLLQLAYERAVTLVDPERVLVCAGRRHMDVIAGQLPDVPDENLLAEPVGRDSLAAIAWSMATIAGRDPDAVAAVLSADHVIEPEEEFTQTLRQALAVAAKDPEALVTCGILPTSPHTGYGYLHVGEPVDGAGKVRRVLRFAEKPTREVAEAYLAQGDWWWNSGMFCWRATTFLDQLKRFQPAVAAAVGRLAARPDLIDEIYPTLTKISVDYAIMEPVSQGLSTAHVLTVGLEAEWTDIGGFPALAHYLGVGPGSHVEGRVVDLGSTGSLLMNRQTDGRLLAVCGVEDLIVVEDSDVTLVCAMDQAERIKELVELAREQAERYV